MLKYNILRWLGYKPIKVSHYRDNFNIDFTTIQMRKKDKIVTVNIDGVWNLKDIT